MANRLAALSLYLISLLFLGFSTAVSAAGPGIDPAWMGDQAWEDGAAVVSVFRGRIRWYGDWREAEIRHYVVREYFHPTQLTKVEPPGEDSIPVLKVNILTSFDTGTYSYRQMASLFYDRRSGELVKAVGSSQEGCGIAFQRWDRPSGQLSFDTYWENEGAGSRPLERGARTFFDNELPALASSLVEGEIVLLPSITTSSVRDRSRTPVDVEVGEGRTTVGDRSYRYDAERFLESWIVPGREEFRRVSKKRLYYWNHTENGDERLLQSD
jgi:hypothetical protein